MSLSKFLSPLFALYCTSLAAAPRPNIIVIMSDDMGYSDIGCYGSEIETPTLDKLASNGLRYTRFYNTGRCCPTRASLLTGLYAHQAGIGQMTNDGGQRGYQGDLSRNAVTIAEALKPAGYRTYMAGKWHVTKQLKPDGDKSNWPMQRGFDRFYGTIIGAGSFFDPWTLTRGNQAITPENDPEYSPKEYYYTDAISDQATRYVKEHAQDHADQPFFMYVSYTAAHWPMHALEKDIKKYKGRYDEGYGTIRKARYEKMKALGVIEDWKLSEAPQKWEDVDEATQEWDLRCMEVYAAMVDSMDQGIGRRTTKAASPPRSSHTGPRASRTKNELRHEPGHLFDVMATCVELSGADYPKQFADHEIVPLEGRSLAGGFASDRVEERTLLFEHYGKAAIRKGSWKLVREGEKKPWELYAIDKDRSELNDLSTKHPEKVKELSELWEQEAKRTFIYPKPKARKRR